MVAVPSRGRADQETPRRGAPEADATRDLYERYARQIHAYCVHQLGNREEAEDAVQSTFLNAFRGLKRGVDPEFESAWLYKIAENVCLTRQRSSSRRRRIESPGDLDAMQDMLPSHQPDSDELIRLPEALGEMPEQQRRALLLREWQGLSYKEIAVELGLSQAAVETLLFRARRSLASALTDEPKAKKAGVARKLRAGGDAGSLFALLKTLIFSGGVKVAASVAAVAATSMVAATPAVRHSFEQAMAPGHSQHAKLHAVLSKTVAPSTVARLALVAPPAATSKSSVGREHAAPASLRIGRPARPNATVSSAVEPQVGVAPPAVAEDAAPLTPAPSVPAPPPAPIVAAAGEVPDAAPAQAPDAAPAGAAAPAVAEVSRDTGSSGSSPSGSPIQVQDEPQRDDPAGTDVVALDPSPAQLKTADKADAKAARSAAKEAAKAARDERKDTRTVSSASPGTGVTADPTPTPTTTTAPTTTSAAPVASPPATPPGQAKKNDPAAAPVPASAPPAPTVGDASPAPQPAPATPGPGGGKSDHGNGNGHGK